MPIDLGDSVTRSINLTSAAGAPVAADSTPVYAVTLPDGTAPTPPTVQTGVTGEYYVVYPTVQSGLHQEVWTALVGGVQVVIRRNFTAESATGSFIDTDEAIAHLRAAGIIVSAADLEQLRWLCQVACSAVAEDLGLTIARRTIVEEHSICERSLVLRHSPVISVTSVNVDGSVTPADPTGYRLDPYGVLITRYGWWSTGWPGTVTVTYVAGYTIPPHIARKVALNGVQRMWAGSQQLPHPSLDDYGAEQQAAAGQLTPLELAAYNSLRAVGIA